jgi:23S rRNA (uridine2552-2'-O)-methyltransferase
LEIQEKDKLIKPGMTVIDLGAAPGGWSQVAAKLVGRKGRVIASDILAMDALDDVEIIQGDFTEEEVFQKIMSVVNDERVDLVISDMAPNMSGMSAVDQPRSMYLVELALDLAEQVLKPGGVFLCKVFHGEGFDDLIRDTRKRFGKVLTRKPQASRARSREVYLVGRDFRPR